MALLLRPIKLSTCFLSIMLLQNSNNCFVVFSISISITSIHRKAEVGNYGEFIYDNNSGETYELPEELRANWLAYFRNAYKKFN